MSEYIGSPRDNQKQDGYFLGLNHMHHINRFDDPLDEHGWSPNNNRSHPHHSATRMVQGLKEQKIITMLYIPVVIIRDGCTFEILIGEKDRFWFSRRARGKIE
jgi:hypothetical protein